MMLVSSASAQDEGDALVKQSWYETRMAHLNIYSCGPKQEVYKLAARLEQFHDAYALLAGAQAVASPPIIVMAFPDQQAMQPFLPVYNGKPANLSGFFKRSSDENLIVLALTGTNSISLDVIFHEYTHLLFRRNDRVWPLWLQEGMAEIYSTFEATGRGVRIGKPIAHHLRLLAQEPMMPLAELFAVTHDSPQYNEAEHQGVFYAESWLLTHFLMNGDNPALKARFGNFTRLLMQGETTEQAFTNAMGMSLSRVDAELKRYLEQGQFESIGCVVGMDLSAPRAYASRPIGQVETCFRFGDELLRINRLDDAEGWFDRAQKIAPASPLPYEGLGLLAAEREKPDEAVRNFKEAFQRGSTSYIAHYEYAEQRLNQTSDGQNHFTRIQDARAGEIRNELEQSVALMPDFGPAQQLLGFFELVQGENLASAEQHLERAIQLEPQNQSYLLSLAQVQMRRRDLEAARRTLEPLRLPRTDPKLRAQAEEVLSEIDREASRR